jgi:hypothetical protein
MGVLKVRVGDAWELVGGNLNEVTVGDVDPFLDDPNATDELWYNRLAQALFVRVNGRWEPAFVNEVTVSRADPAPINPDVELWYDLDAVPSTGGGSSPFKVPDEVWIGATDPNKPTTELWFDTSTNVLKAKVNGLWVAASSPGGGTTGQALTKIDDTDGNVEWSGPHWKMWSGTQAEYDAIATKDPFTLYAIV